MIEPNLSLQKPLEDFVEYFDKLNLRTIPLLSEMSELSLSFQDPHHSIRGSATACSLLLRRFDIYPQGHYRVSDFTWGRKEMTAYIHWSYFFTPKTHLGKNRAEKSTMDGMSEIMFTPDGKIFSITEYWGGAMAFDLRSYKKALP